MPVHPRDGKFIEKIGTYNPLTNPASINLNDQKAFDWLMKGAQPSETVKRMLSYRGIMLKKHLQIGVVKEAITQEQADAKLADWMKSNEAKIQSKVDILSKSKQDIVKARKEAEVKVRATRAEAIRKKTELAAAPAPEVAQPEAETSTEAPTSEAPATETQA